MIGCHSSESIHSQIFHRMLDVIPDPLTVDDVGMSELVDMLPLHFRVVSRAANKLTIMLGYSRSESGGVIINLKIPSPSTFTVAWQKLSPTGMRTYPARSTHRTGAVSTFWLSAC